MIKTSLNNTQILVCRLNLWYGTDNYNTEFSLCMNGLTVLGGYLDLGCSVTR